MRVLPPLSCHSPYITPLPFLTSIRPMLLTEWYPIHRIPPNAIFIQVTLCLFTNIPLWAGTSEKVYCVGLITWRTSIPHYFAVAVDLSILNCFSTLHRAVLELLGNNKRPSPFRESPLLLGLWCPSWFNTLLIFIDSVLKEVVSSQ